MRSTCGHTMKKTDVADMSQMPLVSIIITNYNYGQFLSYAVESALNQRYARIEVVVVDDGSTDESRNVIDGFGERITSVYKQNGGQGSAFNAGFGASRGDIVLFLDADDLLLPTAAERVVDRFKEKNVVKVHWPLQVVDENGALSGGIIPDRTLPEGDLKDVIVEGGPTASISPPTSGNAWARGFLEQVLPIPESLSYFRLGGDEYLFNLAPLFGDIAAVREPQACYRIHGRNMYTGKSFEDKLRFELDGYEQQCLVLHRFMDEMGIDIDVAHWKENSWFHRLNEAIRDLAEIVPEGESIILVDENTWGTDEIAGRRCLPFPARDGIYWGPPGNDEAAIKELMRRREDGARYVAFAWPAFWWMEYYDQFYHYLETQFTSRLRNDRVVLFDLQNVSTSTN